MSQKVIAAQMMRDLEKKYGKTFLEKSLHQARFDYTALSRVVRGLDAEIPPSLSRPQAARPSQERNMP